MSVVYHGERFAGYRLIELIGGTPLTTVYRAFDPVQGCTVALKILDGRPGELTRQRFFRDTATARDLHHPCIVPIYETGEAEGRLFVVMRYMAGGNLGALINGGQRLDPDRVVTLLTEVADALDAAHVQGVAHGDVKPANILVETRGGTQHAYLADFGMTRYRGAANLAVPNTETWSVTPEYMAPEQFEGVLVDALTDVYSLGCVLHHCHLDHPHRSPGLDEVVARALAVRVEDRYPTATAFLTAVRRVLADPAHRDPAATALRNAPAPPRPSRQRSLLLVTALATATLAAAGGLSIGLHGHDRAGTPSTASATSPAFPGPMGLLAPSVAAITAVPGIPPSPTAAAPSSAPTMNPTPATPPARPATAQPQAPATSVQAPAPGDNLVHATMRNTGQTELVAGDASLSNTTAFAIVKDGCAGAHLPAGGSCAVSVRFQPPGPGDYTTILSVPIAGGQPVTFTLRGHRG
jgi:serine/threonine protein kinase